MIKPLFGFFVFGLVFSVVILIDLFVYNLFPIDPNYYYGLFGINIFLMILGMFYSKEIKSW